MKVAFLLLFLFLAACIRVPTVSRSDADRIESAALVMMAGAETSDISSTEWPKEVRDLDPQRVRVTSDGVYIVTSSFFVEEAGVFVPRNPANFDPTRDGDPEFRFQHGHVFSYRIRG